MTETWFDLAAGRQFALLSGERSAGPVAVLVHGAGSDHRVWDRLGAGLVRLGWRVLVPDLPGHGRSGGQAAATISAIAEGLAEVLAAVGLPPGLVVGHSMGALAALEFAARFPDRLTALALVGVATRMPVHPALLAAARDDLPRAAAMIAGWGHAVAGEGDEDGARRVEATRTLLAGSAPGVLAAGLAACDLYDASAAAARITVPTRLILGEADKMSPAKGGLDLAARISGAAASLIDGGGHMLMADRPDAVLNALTDQA